MLPRLAAIVCNAITGMSSSVMPEAVKSMTANGTKVINDTSFVMNIEQKKHKNTRIKIICALFESEMCVCDLSCLLNMTQSAISHQLRVLKSARLVKFRREGKVVYYSLDDEHIKHIYDAGLNHISE